MPITDGRIMRAARACLFRHRRPCILHRAIVAFVNRRKHAFLAILRFLFANILVGERHGDLSPLASCSWLAAQ
jgi:hypothetical protein